MKVLLCFLLFLIPAQTAAQQLTIEYMPEGRRIVHEGETYQAFNLGEYTELLRLDQELQFYAELVPNLEAQIAAFEQSEASLERQIELLRDDVEILQNERQRLFELWQDESLKRLEAEAGSWVDWLGWAAAGVFLVSTATLVSVIALQ